MIHTHADVVGSLLRPRELLQARADLAAGRLAPTAFKAMEDRAVDEAIALQERAGLETVSDGEMRRLSFQSLLPEAVDGFGEWDLNAFLWGEWHGDERVGSQEVERPKALGVVSKLRRKRHLSAEEFTYLRARTSRNPKITLPSPSMWANFWGTERSVDAYPTLDAFLSDVVGLLRDEVAELVRLGATYIQIDAPHYLLLLDSQMRAFYEGQGWTVDRWLDQGIALDNALMEETPGVTFGFHLCRGNQGSRWLVAGGYDRLAEQVFRRIRAQRLLLEYDDARSGGFGPLEWVPEDKTVVLGLVSTKIPRLETPEELGDQIREASRHVPLERLALSPQCGFASSVVGNAMSLEDQERKLRLVVEVAGRTWG
ncbi:MAG: methionine synthase [Chloroflexi bacterium]|nr:methionine synthase [Chloroflexota bacterium]